MTTIRKIVTSKIDGNSADVNDTNEIRPFGETAFYLDTNTNPSKLVLMMFDGIRTHQRSKVLGPGILYGSNADSGDGAGLDTIKLIPDSRLHYNFGDYGNDQHLIIDPTGPDHIHIRAGGTIDNSNADLFLGGELTHVRISDNQDTVVIRTSVVGEGIAERNWIFDNTGALTLPSGSPILFGNGNSRIQAGQGFHINSEEGISLEAVDVADPLNPVSYGWYFGTNGLLTLPGGNTSIGNLLGSDAIISAANTAFGVLSQGSAGFGSLQWLDSVIDPINVAGIVVNSPYAASTGSVQIYTGTVGIPPQNAWTFNPNGSLTLPNAGIVRTGNDTPQVGSTRTIATDSNEGTGVGTPNVVDVAYDNTIIPTYYYSGGGAPNFTDSTITFANGDVRTITSIVATGGYIEITYSGITTTSNPEFPIILKTGNYVAATTAPEWTFGTDGILTLPGDIVTLESDATDGLIINVSTFPEYTTPYKFDGNGNSTSRAISVTDANGVRVGGIIGDGFGPILNAPSGKEVWVSTNGMHLWRFTANSNFVLPPNGDILDSNGQSVLGSRVVSAPVSSIGAAGDKQGDLAFDGSYMYYCTQDFASETYSTTITATYTGFNPDIVKGSIPQPLAGWEFVHNGTTYTLVSNAVETNPGEWNCELDTSISVTADDAVTLGPAASTDIWKRVAWSIDTW